MSKEVDDAFALCCVNSILQTKEQEREQSLARVREARELLERSQKLTYKVFLISHWRHEGEKDAHAEGKSLSAAIRRAERKFMKINNRSDVQAKYEVIARIGSVRNGYGVEIPEEVIKRFLNQ